MKKKTTPREIIEVITSTQTMRVKGLRSEKNLGAGAGMGLAKVRKSLS